MANRLLAGPDLPNTLIGTTVVKRTVVSVFAARSGASRDVIARTATPFILERANPPKDGDAKPWAFDPPAKAGPMVARLPKGWIGDPPSIPGRPNGRSLVRGLSNIRYVTAYPALFSRTSCCPPKRQGS